MVTEQHQMCREIDGWALSTQYQQLLQRNRGNSGSRGNGIHINGDTSGRQRISNETTPVPITTAK